MTWHMTQYGRAPGPRPGYAAMFGHDPEYSDYWRGVQAQDEAARLRTENAQLRAKLGYDKQPSKPRKWSGGEVAAMMIGATLLIGGIAMVIIGPCMFRQDQSKMVYLLVSGGFSILTGAFIVGGAGVSNMDHNTPRENEKSSKKSYPYS